MTASRFAIRTPNTMPFVQTFDALELFPMELLHVLMLWSLANTRSFDESRCIMYDSSYCCRLKSWKETAGYDRTQQQARQAVRFYIEPCMLQAFKTFDVAFEALLSPTLSAMMYAPLKRAHFARLAAHLSCRRVALHVIGGIPTECRHVRRSQTITPSRRRACTEKP